MSRFQRLWAEAETLATENIELEQQLDVLVRRIESEVFEAEIQLGEVIRQVVHRQLDFAQKKSLLKWHRAELTQWIDDNLAELVAMGLLDEPLQNKLAALRAAEMEIKIDPDSELSASEQLEQYFEEDARRFRERLEQADGDTTENEDLFGSDEDGFDFEDDEEEEALLAELLQRLRDENEEQSHSEISDSRGPADKSISDAVFKRLFRQTATALHPDKESDEGRRQQKHHLMSKLLKARKDHDLITILRLHEEYAQAESDLSSDDQQELEQVLVQYLSQQQNRLEEIIRQSPMHHMAYCQFYDNKPATVTRRINAHVNKVDKKRLGLLDFMDQVNTLKRLKEVLAERYESHMFRGDWF